MTDYEHITKQEAKDRVCKWIDMFDEAVEYNVFSPSDEYEMITIMPMRKS